MLPWVWKRRGNQKVARNVKHMSNTIIVGSVGHSQSFHQSPHLTPISCDAFVGITSNVVSTCQMWTGFIPFLKVESCSNNYFATWPIIDLVRCVDAMHATVALVMVRYATYFEIGFANSLGRCMIWPQCPQTHTSNKLILIYMYHHDCHFLHRKIKSILFQNQWTLYRWHVKYVPTVSLITYWSSKQ